jgi:mannosyl-oligosaccharide alpha-1,2-mannosidase
MVFAYVAKTPKRWRNFIAVVIALIILGQLWAFFRPSIVPASDSTEIPTTKSNQNPIPVNQQLNSTIPTPPKQSILLGFGGFLSKLPQLQHNFGPEPKAYTRLREKRRAAVKKSFLHGWKGYSKTINGSLIGYDIDLFDFRNIRSWTR